MLDFNFNNEDSKITVKRADFEETLRAISDGDTDVGFYKCHFKTYAYRSTICVRSNCEYLFGDTEYRNSLTSELDFHLNLVNEISEYTEKTKDRHTKRIIKSRIELDNLVVEIEEILNSNSTQSMQQYPLNDTERFLSNGAILIMKRICVINGIKNALAAHTLNSEGKLCKFSFDLLNVGSAEETSKIQSEIAAKQILESTLENITTTAYEYFTNDGQLLSIVQVGLPIVFKTLELPQPPKKDQYLSSSNAVEDEFDWVENCILSSKYSALKEEIKSQYHHYLRSYPELVDLVKDFLQMILLEKPKDTLNFAATFFTSFSKMRIQPPRLKETEENAKKQFANV